MHETVTSTQLNDDREIVADETLVLKSLYLDSDNDGMGNLCDDIDGDGLSNYDENTAGTSPLYPHTDGESYLDGVEITLVRPQQSSRMGSSLKGIFINWWMEISSSEEFGGIQPIGKRDYK